MSIHTLAAELLGGAKAPEDVKKRLASIRKVRQAEDDGDYLDSIFDACERACDGMNKAASVLSEASSMIEDADRKAGRAPNSDPRYRDLLKSISAVQSQIASFSRTSDVFRQDASSLKGDQDKASDEVLSLMGAALSMIQDASVPLGDARKLLEAADRKARTGSGFRFRLRQRMKSASVLRAVLSFHAGIVHLAGSTRSRIGSQRDAVREASRARTFE